MRKLHNRNEGFEVKCVKWMLQVHVEFTDKVKYALMTAQREQSEWVLWDSETKQNKIRSVALQ